MDAGTESLTIEELDIPTSLDGDAGADFIEMVDMRNQVEAEILGTEDLAPTAKELLPFYSDPFAPKRIFLARVNGRIAGRAVYEWQVEEGVRAVFFEIQVASDVRRRGIGTALLEKIESTAATEHRDILQSWSEHRLPTSANVLRSPTGFGAVERDDPSVQFALAHGYSLEQVDRISRIDLPADRADLARRRSAAEQHSSGYAVVQWIGRCPDRWLADMARLHQRMSTDAPSAGIEFTEEQWDEKRMSNLDDMNEAGGRVNLTSAALHLESGHLVGYTDLALPEIQGRPAVQEDTLVLKEHRGHRLGMLLKIANLEQLMRVSPETPRITTFNAEENRPMLDVNEAVGFVAVGCEAAWKKTVRP